MRLGRPLETVLVASEISPFAKTGGLADMVGSFGLALQDLGVRPTYILPKYQTVVAEGFRPMEITPELSFGGVRHPVQVWSGTAPRDIPIYLLDLPGLFDRSGLYGEHGKDYPDNCRRFAAFCRGALEAIRALQLPCEVLHVHDWQAALLPVYLKTLYAGDPVFQDLRAILTIHNLGYQGIFPSEQFPVVSLSERYFSPRFLEFHGNINLLKGGIVAADALTTVSPTYAREILTPEWGFGLEGVLQTREERFQGILNGIDEAEWNPSSDPLLPTPFSWQDLAGKVSCKEVLQREMRLPLDPQIPLFGIVSRLVDQKGIDLLLPAMSAWRPRKSQWVVLGTGDPGLERQLVQLAQRLPEHVAVRITFDEALAHRITAGADFFLMPSRYEPCGYNQMYAMRYGTVPVVRGIGGLADTVKDVGKHPAEGTGIVFQEANAQGLQDAIGRALGVYKQPGVWRSLQQRMMRQDFSWRRSASQYVDVYQRVMSQPPVLIPA